MFSVFETPIVIPSYEPDDRLPLLLQQLHDAGFHHIVLVDDGSAPMYQHYFETAAETYGCHVLHHEGNKGKGRALKNAFSYILNTYPDAPGCITADSDGQHSPTCIANCAAALLANPDAIVLGVRDFDVDTVPIKSKLGNKATCLAFRLLCGVAVSDTQTGLRGVPRAFMHTLLETEGERFEFESNMLMATRGKLNIIEVPIETIYDSKENHTSHFHPVFDSIRIYKTLGKFLLSSLGCSLLDLSLFQLFIWLCKPHFGYYITVATFLARGISASVNFACNRTAVFQSDAPIAYAGIRYAVLCVLQALASSFLVTQLYSLLPLGEFFTKILVDITLFFISFQIQRVFIFKAKK